MASLVKTPETTETVVEKTSTDTGTADQPNPTILATIDGNDMHDGSDIAEKIAENPVKRTFGDVAVTVNSIEEDIFLSDEYVSYTYKHNRTRDFRCGVFGAEFHFKDYILTINTESENQRWLDTYQSLPIDERLQIVEYHPELIQQIERPVGTAGQAYGQRILRGAVPTSQMNDPRAVNRPKQ